MRLSVVTSKKAAKDLVKIKEHHKAIVQSLTNQKMKLDAMRQQRQQEALEQQKEQASNDMQSKKNMMDFHNKQQELDIKRASLV